MLVTDQTRSHQPVLFSESLTQLAIKPAGLYVDATFGRGGHTQGILNALNAEGRLISFDKDPTAIQYAYDTIQDARLTMVHASFTEISQVLTVSGLLGKVDGMLFDLGVSSPQLDEAERGFSFMNDGPLDMRMNTRAGYTAAEWLSKVNETILADVIFEFGEERFSRRIARAIVEARKISVISTTKQLAEIVATAVPKREPFKHPATRTFQAIRIFINSELEDLKIALAQSLDVLAVGGRLVVISFHSLEDRLVKQFMKRESSPPEIPRHIPIKHTEFNPRLKIVHKPIFPSDEEVSKNIRARSAVLRTAEKER
ncbi:MAG: 16S rRNA (cytosine(1402)-N(4))-methyltransferase RsmH [Legionellales bacterium]|nr:16S rRNA (cytosine(1402)-N(4))-methyltransferase RsmH [Legionellales bacterium]